MVVRTTPPEDVDRINDRLFREARFQIQDRDSYDLAFNDLFTKSTDELTGRQLKLRKDGFNLFRKDHPEVSKERLFTKAKGKDLKRDRRRTARRVVTTREQFIKEGASEVDLKGFDTARQKVKREVIRRRTFNVPARVRGRVVFAKKTSVVVKGKRVVRFRDARGRFVSPKVR